MKSEKSAIVLLAVTAALLLTAFVFIPAPKADAAFVTIKDRDYMVATTPVQQGGDALYVCDVRTGLLAVFVYDPNTRSLQVRSRLPMNAFFPAR